MKTNFLEMKTVKGSILLVNVKDIAAILKTGDTTAEGEDLLNIFLYTGKTFMVAEPYYEVRSLLYRALENMNE